MFILVSYVCVCAEFACTRVCEYVIVRIQRLTEPFYSTWYNSNINRKSTELSVFVLSIGAINRASNEPH